ncbi:gp436 family protein [Ursidibacter arcticus]
MTYITPNDLAQAFSETVLIKLSNDDYRATEMDLSTLARAIQIAEERIDAALRSRYRLPLVEVPTLLQAHALNLARYWLYSRRPEMPMPEMVEKTYQQTIKELEQIANGRLHLGVAGFTEPSDEPTKQGDLLKDNGEYQVISSKRIDTRGY